jgi:hypothetical protein
MYCNSTVRPSHFNTFRLLSWIYIYILKFHVHEQKFYFLITPIVISCVMLRTILWAFTCSFHTAHNIFSRNVSNNFGTCSYQPLFSLFTPITLHVEKRSSPHILSRRFIRLFCQHLVNYYYYYYEMQNYNFDCSLYWCESWSLAFKEERRLWVCESMVLRRIFESKSN